MRNSKQGDLNPVSLAVTALRQLQRHWHQPLRSVKGRVKLGAASTCVWQRSDLALSKAFWHSSGQTKSVFGLSKLVNGWSTEEKFLQKFL